MVNYLPTTIIFDANTASKVTAKGFKVPGPRPGATHLGGDLYVYTTGTSNFLTESELVTYGPVVSRTIDVLGGGLTGESVRIGINIRAGGCIERVYLTEPGGITDTNVIVNSRGYGRGMQGSMFFDTAENEMFVTVVTRGATTRITTAKPHGIETNKLCPISILESGSETGVITPNLNGVFYAKGVTTTTLDLYTDVGGASPYSTAAGAGTYTVNNKMKLAFLKRNNPTMAGGGYSDVASTPYAFFHSSPMLYSKFEALKTDASGNITSAVLETACIPIEWDPDGIYALGPTESVKIRDHGGGRYNPVLWNGMMFIQRIYINPIVPGTASYGLPGVWRYETEVLFLDSLENFASNSGETRYLGVSVPGIECPNIHFKQFVAAQRAFQARYMWRGANNTNVLLTGRNFKNAGDPSLGTWDDLEHQIFLNSQTGGAYKQGPTYNGAPDAAEMLAVVGDVVTGGVWSLVMDRTIAGTQFACGIVMHHHTVSAYGRHNLMSYLVFSGTHDVDGTAVEQSNIFGEMRDYSNNRNGIPSTASRLQAKGPQFTTYPAGYRFRNWGHVFWGANAAELLTNFGGSGLGKLGLFFVGALDTNI